MPHSFPRTVSCLALVLGAGVGPAQGTASTPAPRTTAMAQVRAAAAQHPLRVAQALASLQSQAPMLGLHGADAFTADQVYSNAQGQTIVRLAQLYQGHRVWGGSAMAKVSPTGQVALSTPGVLTGISLTGAPALTAAQATQLALAKLLMLQAAWARSRQEDPAPAFTQGSELLARLLKRRPSWGEARALEEAGSRSLALSR